MRTLIIALQTAVLGAVALFGTWFTATRSDDFDQVQELAGSWTRIDAAQQNWLSPVDKMRLGLPVTPDPASTDSPTTADDEPPRPQSAPDQPTEETPSVDVNDGALANEDPTVAAGGDGDNAFGGSAVADGPEIDVAALPREIDLATAKAIWDRNQEVPHDPVGFFVDARSSELYAQGHVPFAYSIPYTVMRSENAVPQQIADGWLDAGYGKPVIVYCGGGDCDESQLVAQDLREIYGFTTHILVAGFADWAAAGFPTEVGPDETLIDPAAGP